MRFCVVLSMVICAALYAAPPAKTFEVSTVKPNSATDNRVMLRILPGGGFQATGVTLKMLIAEAYDVRDFQVTGGPAWINTDRWDINAKVEGVTDRIPLDEFRPMLQKLLEDRFQVTVRREQKEMPVYALVPAKGGVKIHPVEGEGGRIGMSRGALTGEKIPIQMLARSLAQMVGRPVVDQSGLTGNYDFTLRYTPEIGQGGPVAVPGGTPPPETSGDGPSIFTALQEQLGLRLDSQKAPVEVLVISRVEKPSEN